MLDLITQVFNQGIAEYQTLRAQWGAFLDLFIVVLAVVGFNLLLRFVLNHLEKKVIASENIWDDAIFNSVSKPGRVLAWVIGLNIAIRVAKPPEDTLLAEFIDPARTLALIAVFAWFLLRVVNEIKKNILIRARRRGEVIDETLVDALGKLLRASVVITAILVALESMGVSVSGVLAFGGVGGIAVGFAAKDLLANIFGGVTIYLNRPFSVGDWIRSPDRDIEGIVEKIGWRFVSLRRFDKRALYVPNAIFTNVSLENPSRMTHRRISETIGLRYDDVAVVPAIVADIHTALEEDEEIDSNQIILVYFNTFGAYSLDIMVYCYTVTTQWDKYLQVQQQALLRCHEIIAAHGADVAYPTSDVRIPEGLEFLATNNDKPMNEKPTQDESTVDEPIKGN